MKSKATNTSAKFTEILKEAYESGSTLQIPYTIKNGKFKDEESFHLLRFLDDEPITVISTTKTKLVLEITNQGACNMLKHFNEAIEEKYKNEKEYEEGLMDFLLNEKPAFGKYTEMQFKGFKHNPDYIDIQLELIEYILRI